MTADRRLIVASVRRAVVAKHGSDCWLCRRPIVGTVSMDHLVPRCFGGSDLAPNLRPAHVLCNTMRGEWDVGSYYDWAASSGRLELLPEGMLDVLERPLGARSAQAAVRYAQANRGKFVAPVGARWDCPLLLEV